jgi:hypothetical protein
MPSDVQELQEQVIIKHFYIAMFRFVFYLVPFFLDYTIEIIIVDKTRANSHTAHGVESK